MSSTMEAEGTSTGELPVRFQVQGGIALRRTILVALALVVGALMASGLTASAQEQGPDRVYFEQTGHYLGGEFLDFWREYGGIQTFGYPITPEIEEDGMTVQYFERHVLELHPENSDDYRVLLRRLGAEARDARDLNDHEAFQPVAETSGDNVRYFPETGQTMASGFLDYWESNGALRIFGYPLSEEFEHNGTNVQFLERAVIEWHPDNPDDWKILFERLGAQAAERNGVDTSPQEHDGDTPQYEEDLWYTPEPEPTGPTPPAGAPVQSGKWMEVDLTNQMFRAWQGDELVYSAYISSGRPVVPTLTGTYQTYAHYRYDDMRGETPDQGEYYLPDVPYTMYYDGGYALHGTYWHNNFGWPMSAGCVNMTIADAAWVYNWASVGTTVWVHGWTPGS